MKTLTKEELMNMNKYFNALNYLSVGQLYLLDNPLLRRKLSINDLKPNVVGHWGTAPGQNFIFCEAEASQSIPLPHTAQQLRLLTY